MGKTEALHVKFEKIQTWLFAIPRLRAMVGANVLLADVLHEKLPKLIDSPDGRWKIAGPKDKKYPKAHDDDPLRAYDDPKRDADHGITSRDGGHFVVQLESGFEELSEEITQLLHRELPGLRFTIHRASKRTPHSSQRTSFTSPELPVLAPCKWSGAGLASARALTGDDEEHASLEAVRRQAAARRAARASKNSYANAFTNLLHGEVAETFEALAAGRYLAVIHADGNGVGSEVSSETSAVKLAAFHHRNRVAMKVALARALGECRDDEAMRRGHSAAPLLPLLRGGDDLLVACRANVALPFVQSLCRHLEDFQEERRRREPSPHDLKFKLTLGVGVVFAPYTLPFNRMHEAAEALAASAKRNAEKKQLSIVDWSVCTSAWVDKDVLSTRTEWLRGPPESQRVLSRRPMPVLASARAPEAPSLQRLLRIESELTKAGVARSQLRYLAEQLSRGETLAQLAWHELAPATKRALEEAKVSGPWDPASAPTSAASPTFTSLIDLVEVLEIPRLGATR